MQIPNRPELEDRFARRLERLNARQRKQLIVLMGTPPRLENVPASFWRDCEREVERETMIILYLVFMASAHHHDWDSSAADPVAATWSQSRAASLAASYVDTTRDRIGGALKRLGQAQSTAGGLTQPPTQPPTGGPPSDEPPQPSQPAMITQEDLDAELVRILGPDRAANTAINETTAAQNAGGDAAVAATVGLSELDEWETHPERSKSGPCPRCAAMNGVKRRDWAAVALPLSGHGLALREPGSDPGCCCSTRYANLQRGG